MAQLAGAEPEERGVVLLALLDHCAIPADHALRSGDEGRIKQFWIAYHEDLQTIPYAVLHGACRRWRAAPTSKAAPIKWFPSSGELMAWCRQDERWVRAVNIAKGLSRMAAATVERPREVLTPEQEAEVDAKWAAMKERLRL